MKKIVIVLGPTAVGKSEMGIKLAKEFNGEIISADSVQIYKGLDIGSAKVKKEEMQGILHHFIDILPPQSEFSVCEYVEMTRKKIDDIIANGHLPIIVGGTGLYVRALLNGYDFGGTGKQEEFRDKLNDEYQSIEDIKKLYLQLKMKAPSLAEKICDTDKKRIIRALEIAEFGDQPTENKADYDALVFNLSMDRETLYNRINCRAEIMFEQGLIDEVKGLLNKGVPKNAQSMKAIGYKEVVSFLDGETSKENMIELVKQHSRNYAKRQMTFFRSLKESNIISMDNREQGYNDMKKLVKEWL